MPLAFEVVLNNLSNIATFLEFAAGFAMGTYVGLLIEEKLSIGMVVVRIITNEGADVLMEKLKAGNYGATRMEGLGPENQWQFCSLSWTGTTYIS